MSGVSLLVSSAALGCYEVNPCRATWRRRVDQNNNEEAQ